MLIIATNNNTMNNAIFARMVAYARASNTPPPTLKASKASRSAKVAKVSTPPLGVWGITAPPTPDGRHNQEHDHAETEQIQATRYADRNPRLATAQSRATAAAAQDRLSIRRPLVSDDRPDAMLLGRIVAAHLGFDAKAAARLGRSIGVAIGRFVSRPGSHD